MGNKLMKPGDKLVCIKTINDGFSDVTLEGETGFINKPCFPRAVGGPKADVQPYQVLWGEQIPYNICIAYENEIELINV